MTDKVLLAESVRVFDQKGWLCCSLQDAASFVEAFLAGWCRMPYTLHHNFYAT